MSSPGRAALVLGVLAVGVAACGPPGEGNDEFDVAGGSTGVGPGGGSAGGTSVAGGVSGGGFAGGASGGEAGGTAAGGSSGGSSSGGGSTGGGSSGGGSTGGGSSGGVSGGQAGGWASDGGTRVPAFVLVGKQRRRAISYDDGRSWVNDVSFQNPDGAVVRCGDCDHDEFSPTGLAVSGEFVLHATGHGAPGTVYRSRDGVTFTPTLTNYATSGLLVEGGKVLLATRGSRFSVDDGLTWSTARTIPFRGADGSTIWNARGSGAGHGVFIVTANDAALFDLQVSSDALTWTRGVLTDGGRADSCGSGSPVFGASKHLLLRGTGALCISADDGLTWAPGAIPNVNGSVARLLWTGSEFLAWSTGRLHRSTDGLSWTNQNAVVVRPDGGMAPLSSLGPVRRSASGTFVSATGSYETQAFFRSTDGLVWHQLPPGAFVPGHPVTHFVHTQVSR